MRVLTGLVSLLAVLGTLYQSQDLFTQTEDQVTLKLTRTEAALLEYKNWKLEFKSMANEINEVDYYRFYIWCENYNFVVEHNSNPENTFTVGMNKFADITNQEFRSMYFGLKPSQENKQTDVKPISAKNANTNVDWTKQGATGNVLDQGQCGSCWSFSAAEQLQSVNYLNTKNFQYYSEQQLVDCSTSYGNEGCNGGTVEAAFDYVIKYGIEPASNYPYKAVDGTCKYSAALASYPIKTYVDIPSGNCDDLASAIQSEPVSVAIDAGGIWFQLYTGGVFNKCGTTLDHAVLLVGYVSNAGSGYWIVQNSWGTGWGQKGFIWIALGDTCGICDQACYGNL